MIITIIEGSIVGVYCTIILFFVKMLIKTGDIFLVGFLKHLLGHILKIQQYFCYFHYKVIISEELSWNIIFQSLLEGTIFLLIGKILLLRIKNKYIVVFIIGFILHILSEILGIHKRFCLSNDKD